MDKIDCEQVTFGQDARPSSSRGACRTYLTLLKIAGISVGLVLLLKHLWPASGTHPIPDDLCPQAEALTSPEHEALLNSLDREFGSSVFKLKAYESLGGAVRIATEIYDDIGPPEEDPRWEAMAKFHDYLESRFPRVHANLKRTKVNTYALLYEWKGSENAKPLMLAAHMDVVPVNPDTYDDWVHPPYSGFYDGEWIWGRGSCDDKSDLIGSLTTIETLLEHGFVPSRTVLLAFGIDEEIGGRRGARSIAQHLLELYGPDSLAMIVDEGSKFSTKNGLVFASPATAEKGSMNIRMEVFTPGGHSSTPPKHTAIGILADLITQLESHPNQPELHRGGAYYQSLECRVKHDPSFPEALRQLLLALRTSDEKLGELGDRLAEFDPSYHASAGTTQAIDLVSGGVKVNALPEVAWAAVNNRIAGHSSPSELMARFTDITLPVSVKHNMTLEAFGESVGSQGPSRGTIRLSDFNNNGFGPSPTTPTTGSGPWALFSGTILSTIETHLRTDDLPKSAIVSPGLNLGNTDTRHYWNLTKHIFRYSHRSSRDSYDGVHTINEAIRAEAFLEHIRFFTRLVLNADRSDLLE